MSIVGCDFQRREMRLFLRGRRQFDSFARAFKVFILGFRLLFPSAAIPTYPPQPDEQSYLGLDYHDRNHLLVCDAHSPTMLMWLRPRTAPRVASPPRLTAPTPWNLPPCDCTRQDIDMGASWWCRPSRVTTHRKVRRGRCAAPIGTGASLSRTGRSHVAHVRNFIFRRLETLHPPLHPQLRP